MTKAELEQYRSIVAELIDAKQQTSGKFELSRHLYTRKKNVEIFIENIKDIKLKRIFKQRYIIGKHKPSYQQIAIENGYRDEGTPRKKIKKYLELSENSEIGML